MAKDPAFLFYSSDFLTGTQFFTHEQRGKYITLLCLQHQQGHLREQHMLMVCGTYDIDVFSKFTKDANGLYYQPRLETEIEKRNKYCESRRENRLKGGKEQEAGSKRQEQKEKEKEEREQAEDKIILPFRSGHFLKLWNHWKNYREREHQFAYASVQSEQAALNKLAKLSAGVEQTAAEILIESMANGWKGFFELKNNIQNAAANNNHTERNTGIKQVIFSALGDTSRSF